MQRISSWFYGIIGTNYLPVHPRDLARAGRKTPPAGNVKQNMAAVKLRNLGFFIIDHDIHFLFFFFSSSAFGVCFLIWLFVLSFVSSMSSVRITLFSCLSLTSPFCNKVSSSPALHVGWQVSVVSISPVSGFSVLLFLSPSCECINLSLPNKFISISSSWWVGSDDFVRLL